MEQGQFKAWGYLVYDAPLTEKQMDDYELRAAPGNPDIQDHKQEWTGKKSIATRLAEGAEQAAKDNAARPAPDKNIEKDR